MNDELLTGGGDAVALTGTDQDGVKLMVISIYEWEGGEGDGATAYLTLDEAETLARKIIVGVKELRAL